MPSFDVVSEVDHHELSNAVDQANREVGTRFDFKGTGSRFDLNDSQITMHTQSEFQLQQMYDVLFRVEAGMPPDLAAWTDERYACASFGSGNYSWYCNKDVDVLLKEARTSADAKARSAGYEKAAAKVAQDSGGLFIASSRASAAFVRRLKGLRFAPIGETFELRMLSME